MALSKDDFTIRCPRLGHQARFSYCRHENSGLPCFKAISCRQNYFPVADYLRRELGPDEWEKVFHTPPKPKVVHLFELIQKAKGK
ncbi:MAG: hypothetical protein D4R73_01070 [Deltaproteobacteria bacterium]|nr:MAG: hypothetical protein D4R73_01070 [Deltaproteobacteria bacterium]